MFTETRKQKRLMFIEANKLIEKTFIEEKINVYSEGDVKEIFLKNVY